MEDEKNQVVLPEENNQPTETSESAEVQEQVSINDQQAEAGESKKKGWFAKLFKDGEGEAYEESSELSKKYKIAVYVLTALMALLGIYLAYRYITADVNWTALVEWNCFESPLFAVLCFIGFFLQFFNWTHSSYTEYYHWKDPDSGKDKYERNDDILSWLFGHLVWPLISHLIIIPLIYGAAMYYPLMCIIWLVSSLVPIIAVILIASFVWYFCRVSSNFLPKLNRIYLLIGWTIISTLIMCLLWLPVSGTTSSTISTNNGDSSKDYPKIIEVTANVADIRTGTQMGSKIAKDKNGLDIKMPKGVRLYAVGEYDGWYQVKVTNYQQKTERELGYINNLVSKPVNLSPIELNNNFYYYQKDDEMCSSFSTLVRHPEGSNHIFRYVADECTGNSLTIGDYVNGFYVFRKMILMYSLEKDNKIKGLRLEFDEGGRAFYGSFGSDVARIIKTNGVEEEVVDWSKVPEKALLELFKNKEEYREIFEFMTSEDLASYKKADK